MSGHAQATTILTERVIFPVIKNWWTSVYYCEKQIVDTIEYNLEQLDDLTVEELELLKETTDALIEHVENLKEGQANNKRWVRVWLRPRIFVDCC